MKINPGIPAPDNTATSQVSNSRSGAARNASSISGEPQDTVQLSSGQATIRQLVTQLAKVPDVRQQKINSLSLAIQSGQYQPTNDQVAGAIVKDLFGSASKA